MRMDLDQSLNDLPFASICQSSFQLVCHQEGDYTSKIKKGKCEGSLVCSSPRWQGFHRCTRWHTKKNHQWIGHAVFSASGKTIVSVIRVGMAEHNIRNCRLIWTSVTELTDQNWSKIAQFILTELAGWVNPRIRNAMFVFVCVCEVLPLALRNFWLSRHATPQLGKQLGKSIK